MELFPIVLQGKTKAFSTYWFLHLFGYKCVRKHLFHHTCWFQCPSLDFGSSIYPRDLLVLFFKIFRYVLGAVFLQLCQLLSLQEHPIVQKAVDPSLFIGRYTNGKSLFTLLPYCWLYFSSLWAKCWQVGNFCLVVQLRQQVWPLFIGNVLEYVFHCNVKSYSLTHLFGHFGKFNSLREQLAHFKIINFWKLPSHYLELLIEFKRERNQSGLADSKSKSS